MSSGLEHAAVIGAAQRGGRSLPEATEGVNMQRVEPWVIGAALATAIAAVYIACAVSTLLFPDAFIAFANNWVHGIDLSLIKRPAAQRLSAQSWGLGFVTAVVSAFLVGAIYGWARNGFARVNRSR